MAKQKQKEKTYRDYLIEDYLRSGRSKSQASEEADRTIASRDLEVIFESLESLSDKELSEAEPIFDSLL